MDVLNYVLQEVVEKKKKKKANTRRIAIMSSTITLPSSTPAQPTS
jgi:hypothetical protein